MVFFLLKFSICRLRLGIESILSCVAAKHPKRKTLSKELEEEESTLRQSIEKLKVVETNRLSLVSQLRAALNEQVSDRSIRLIFLFVTYIWYCTCYPTCCLLIFSGIWTRECSDSDTGFFSHLLILILLLCFLTLLLVICFILTPFIGTGSGVHALVFLDGRK